MNALSQGVYMKRKMLAVGIALLSSGGAMAQSLSFDDIVVFGDSLMDVGNFGFRFTNTIGPTYDPLLEPSDEIGVQALAEHLGLALTPASVNGNGYATGGYTSAQILNSVVAPNGFQAGAVTRNGYLVERNNIANPNALYVIDGGGNDFLNGLITSDPSTIVASVTNIVTAVGALDQAGAEYIALANLPDLGNAAGARAGDLGAPGTSAAASAGAAGFNTFLASGVNSLGANVIPIDLNGTLALIQSSPEKFGVSNGQVNLGPAGSIADIHTCFDASNGGCVEHPVFGRNTAGGTADPNRLIFNDGSHPTSKVNAVLGDYLIDVFSAPQHVSLLALASQSSTNGQLNIVKNKLSAVRWSDIDDQWFASISNQSLDTDAGGSADSLSVAAGIVSPKGEHWVTGVAFTLGDQSNDIASSSFDSTSLGVTGMAGYHNDRFFADLTAGIHHSTYNDISRQFTLDSVAFSAQGETSAFSSSADFLTGYNLFSDSQFALAPAVGFKMVHTSVDGYTESGGEVSNYAWGDQSIASSQFRYGLVTKYQSDSGFQFRAEVFSQSEQNDDVQHIDIRNTNLAFNSYRLPNYQADGDSFVTTNVAVGSEMLGADVELVYSYDGQFDASNQIMVNYTKTF